MNLPSMMVSNSRLPTVFVAVAWLAKYSRTSTGVPAATGNAHAISGSPATSARSSVKTAFGVLDGTEALFAAVRGEKDSAVLPVLWYGEGVALVSMSQVG